MRYSLIVSFPLCTCLRCSSDPHGFASFLLLDLLDSIDVSAFFFKLFLSLVKIPLDQYLHR